jgi:hypothetical protein
MGKRRALRLGLVGIIGLSSLGIMAEAGAQQAYDLEGTVIGARTVAPGTSVTYRVTLASEPGLEADHVRLRLFGPNDGDCDGASVHEQTFAVAGGQLAYQTTSAPLASGSYQWTADWGNATNLDNELCGDPDGQFTVFSNAVAARVGTVASPDVVLGGQVWDVATLSNLSVGQGATVTFRLYGPDDATCSRTPAFATSEPANSTTIVSDPFTPGLPGHYRWVTSYYDGTDVVLQGSCNDPDEDVFVWDAPHLPPTTVPDPSRLRIEVEKTPEPASRPAPGGTFTFHIRVTNHSAVSVTLHDLDDSMHGDLDGVGTCATPQHIGVGASYHCSFEGPFIGDAGDQETNIVIARASRRGYADVGDRDEATIHLTAPVPTTTTVAPTTTTPVTVLGNQIARTGSEARLMTLWAILVLSVGAMFVVVAIDLHLRREARQVR